jgi:Kdo2-lipid IVA lauroyltransferase/acyltransferase
MDLKKSIKRTSYSIGEPFLKLCSLIINKIPFKAAYRLAFGAGFLFYLLSGKYRKVAYEGLTQAFDGEKDREEIKKIAKDCFVFIAKSATELMLFRDNPVLLRERADIENKEIIDKALSEEKGVILVSAHLGNFPVILARLSLEGYNTAVIMRPLKIKAAAEVFQTQSAKFNIEAIYSIPRKACVEGAIRSLRKNRLLLLPLDQNFGTAGVYVDFFGRKAATATGPIVLAQRTGALIVPCFILRQKDDRHKIIFEQPIKLQNQSTEEETISFNVQKITDVIESYIRKYPAQWSWIHRRWKSRPKQGGG